MRIAITRGVSPNIKHCELTYIEREAIDVDIARRQHRLYEGILRDLGCQVERLPEDSDFPDSVFVEDIAVVLDEIAIITLPGAPSRRGERSSIERALAPYRLVERIEAPGILDGGDVLGVGNNVQREQRTVHAVHRQADAVNRHEPLFHDVRHQPLWSTKPHHDAAGL